MVVEAQGIYITTKIGKNDRKIGKNNHNCEISVIFAQFFSAGCRITFLHTHTCNVQPLGLVDENLAGLTP